MKWLDAIIEVLREAEEPMHYVEITEAIIKQGKRTEVGATPANSVAAAIGRNLDIFEKTDAGKYALRSTFDYAKWKGEDKTTENEETASLDTEITKESRKTIIKAFGKHWQCEKIDWSKTEPSLVGRQTSKSQFVDFKTVRGVYMLYDHSKLVYVGVAVDESIAKRLKHHTKDKLCNLWNNFSWFGIDGVNQNGTIRKVNTFSVKIDDVAKALEAIVIEGTAPPCNKRGGDYLKGREYKQI
ncbi:HTH domain-containing protein [uncultured Alistipes sp.]|uniref:HTH domain-containing protein n=1 Tax=uncultured Alistipes sp. TaxID=538949 RepID=UPI0027295C31|nr:HTH domain-containing protein [uncultured Alistipes sp.]